MASAQVNPPGRRILVGKPHRGAIQLTQEQRCAGPEQAALFPRISDPRSPQRRKLHPCTAALPGHPTATAFTLLWPSTALVDPHLPPIACSASRSGADASPAAKKTRVSGLFSRHTGPPTVNRPSPLLLCAGANLPFFCPTGYGMRLLAGQGSATRRGIIHEQSAEG